MSEKQCKKCKSQKVLSENKGGGVVVLRCQDCGFHEARDERGAPLLMEVPQTRPSNLLG